MLSVLVCFVEFVDIRIVIGWFVDAYSVLLLAQIDGQ